VFDLPERVPIRLVQENGDRIDLDVQTMDINVHRAFAAFPIPFTGGFNAGVDLNQASVEIELQGVFADEPGQAAGAKATASIHYGSDTPPFSPPDSGSGQGDGPTVFPPTGNSSSSGFRIGGSAFNPAGQAPVIPTSPPTTEDQAQTNYLARLHNRYFELPVAYQMSTSPYPAPPAGNSVRFIFDSKRSGSVKEPFAYPRMVTRNTDLTTASSSAISANSNGTLTISITSGDPRTWFETPDDLDDTAFGISFDSTLLGYVHSVTSNTIVFTPFSGITTSTSANSKTIKIVTRTGQGIYNKSSDRPAIAIPIKHMFDESPPNFADGSSRSVGTATNPAEVLAYIVSQAISSTTASSVGGVTDRGLNAADSGQLADAFITTLATDNNGFNTKINIEQQFAFDLEGNGGIATNIPANMRPVIQGFTGGITGNKVKSAGDKVQDILGIVANSNNTQRTTTGSFAGDVLEFIGKITDWIDRRPTLTAEQGDYILGIQIPYDTEVTKGIPIVDDVFAQRNFFITHGDQSKSQKVAKSNMVLAKRRFNPNATNSRRNGIKAAITDFAVMHDAQERLYNFTMKLIAVDSLI
jgi:hypothetical protein